jgi:hypothetical protein
LEVGNIESSYPISSTVRGADGLEKRGIYGSGYGLTLAKQKAPWGHSPTKHHDGSRWSRNICDIRPYSINHRLYAHEHSSS